MFIRERDIGGDMREEIRTFFIAIIYEDKFKFLECLICQSLELSSNEIF